MLDLKAEVPESCLSEVFDLSLANWAFKCKADDMLILINMDT